jgi:hypothetical protein
MGACPVATVRFVVYAALQIAASLGRVAKAALRR